METTSIIIDSVALFKVGISNQGPKKANKGGPKKYPLTKKEGEKKQRWLKGGYIIYIMNLVRTLVRANRHLFENFMRLQKGFKIRFVLVNEASFF